MNDVLQNHNPPPDSPTTKTPHLRRVLVALAIGLTAAAAGVGGRIWYKHSLNQRLLSMLHSHDPELRKKGAWETAEEREKIPLAYIARQLDLAREPNADVREAYAHALGDGRRVAPFETLATVIQTDPSGYVRQTAWLSAARINEQRFRALINAYPNPPNAWDQIGQAKGLMRLGDTSGINNLLHWAEHGDPDQRLTASNMLRKSVLPLLEAAGQWPLQVDTQPGEVWPPHLLQKVRNRIARINLQKTARIVLQQRRAAADVIRNSARLSSARDHVAKWLTWR